MSDTEHIPADKVEVIEVPPSLFDEHNLRMVDLGGGPVFLTPEGQGIFSQHIRMDQAQRIANTLGYLIQKRAEEPVTEPITVVDFDVGAMEGHDQLYIAGQAVRRTPNFLGIDGIWMSDLEDHKVFDEHGLEVTINEVQLPGGAFVSTHTGYGVCKVLLTPESVLVPELPQTL